VYVCEASGTPIAADDARAVKLFDPLHLPALVFDHATIVADYLVWRQRGTIPLPRV
jgi:8-oxo-dGTP diphosphatase